LPPNGESNFFICSAVIPCCLGIVVASWTGYRCLEVDCGSAIAAAWRGSRDATTGALTNGVFVTGASLTSLAVDELGTLAMGADGDWTVAVATPTDALLAVDLAGAAATVRFVGALTAGVAERG